MPFDRIRVGISSESASQTHTPGPTAKKPMKTKIKIAVSQPLPDDGIGVSRAFSIVSGAVVAACRFAKGFLKNASTALEGTQLPLSIFRTAPRSVERTTGVAARKSP